MTFMQKDMPKQVKERAYLNTIFWSSQRKAAVWQTARITRA